jgi:secreted trypsin-like serine protease
MRFALSLAFVAAPALAFADDGGKTEAPRPDTVKDVPIIGGAAAGSKWPDAVGVLYGGVQECTGTLIAPNVVITAGHCVIGGAPSSVLVGASALSKRSEGETIAVMKSIEYPASQTSIDIGVLILKADSKFPPRPVASGWARWDITNGASVEFVGYGTTDRNGSVETDALLEAKSTITDFNCTTSSGCNTSAKPDGELGAGGMGIDTCPGDSGGPMYLLTEYGNFLAGVTSRSYDNATYACGEGGIYGRPDKIVDWIAEQTQATIAVGPTPTADNLEVVRGDAAETKITHNDPKSNSHTFAIKTQPGYGKAAVSEDGVVRVCAQKDIVGMDKLVVTVTDANNSMRTADIKLAVNIVDGDPPDDCDETAFGDDGGGCCSASRDARGSIVLAAFVLLSLRRRRSR